MDTILTVSNLLLWLFLIFQFICFILLSRLVVNFLNRFRISNRSADPVLMEVGSLAPLFRETDHAGNTVALSETQGKPTLLLFTNDTCPICKVLIPKLPELKRKLDIRVIVVAPEVKNEAPKEIPDTIHFIRSNQIIEDYRRPGTPQMIMIDPKRYIIGNDIVADARQLEILIRYQLQIAG